MLMQVLKYNIWPLLSLQKSEFYSNDNYQNYKYLEPENENFLHMSSKNK